jgi:N-acetylglucosaminyldiphosphoundecaprenol N-acetyl-beta-D-mannosaminyltransferase
MMCGRKTANVLGVSIDALDWTSVLDKLLLWARARESRYVAVCNAHVVVTAARDADYGQVINEADMAVPDGAPVAWMLRRQGFARQSRISGPDLMWLLCQQCAGERLLVYFFGGTEQTLLELGKRLRQAMPQLLVAGLESPPFRTLTPQEDVAVVERINASQAGIVFVGLGCPKQERWMAEHRGRVKAVMIGVGAAFDFHAGTIKRAPLWMQVHGLEWLHRLGSEPRRLWKRYLVTNTLFIVLAFRQLVLEKDK